MNRPQIVVAAMVVGVGISILAGYTPVPAPSHEWSARMSALLSDPSGQGGAGGDLGVDSGAKTAHASVELADVPRGDLFTLIAVD